MDKELNEKHLKYPQPGDYWEEMLCGVCVVLAVKDCSVVICRNKKDVGNNHWTWDLSNVEAMSIVDFNKWLSYGEIPGTWARVRPQQHMWAVNDCEVDLDKIVAEKSLDTLLECNCVKRYSVEPHGDGYAVYHGRCGHLHGANVAHITECRNDFPEWLEKKLNG